MEKLARELVKLGLTSREAYIYIFFAQNNSDKKKEVMNQLHIGEQELSDSFQRLTKKGFMETGLEDSKKFAVIPIQTVMERLIKEKLREVQDIKGEIRNYKLP